MPSEKVDKSSRLGRLEKDTAAQTLGVFTAAITGTKRCPR
jgi:hypothetical protein